MGICTQLLKNSSFEITGIYKLIYALTYDITLTDTCYQGGG